MNIRKYPKQEIARKQLETALDLFFEKGDLFSVVTLAGAAEEILGQLLSQRRGGEGHPFRKVLDILRPGKSSVAGGGALREDDLHVHMDLDQEAVFLLGRAIDDYLAVGGQPSAKMLRFRESVRGSKG